MLYLLWWKVSDKKLSDQVLPKPDCTATEDSYRLQISDFHIFGRIIR